MAPIGMVDVLGWFSPEVGIISLIAFLVLSITLVALCAKCHRSGSGDTYDMSGTKNEGGNRGANGTTGIKSADTMDSGASTWRNHRNMPPNTLERSAAETQ